MRAGSTIAPALAVLLTALAGPVALGDAGGPRSTVRAGEPADTACLTAAVRSRLDVADGGAKYRYALEASGAAAGAALQRVQADAALGSEIAAGSFGAAVAEAQSLLVRHVVRIRIVLAGGRALDANPVSFDVAGARGPIRAPGGRVVGEAEVSVQDVLGFVKLGHRFTGAELRVTGTAGQVVSSLPALVGASLPASGCVTVAGRAYAVRSFGETGFAGEPLSVSVLVGA